MTDIRLQQAEWIRALCAHLGMPPTALARKAGLAHGTVLSLLQSPLEHSRLKDKTLEQLAGVAGVRPMEFPGRSRPGVSEEAAPYAAPDTVVDAMDGTDRAVRALVQGRNGRDPWVIHTPLLDLQGIRPGDIAIVDLNRRPKSGDVVCAQVYDWIANRTQTIFRLFEPPFLLTHSAGVAPLKPVVVDDDAVVIKGVVDTVLRRLAH